MAVLLDISRIWKRLVLNYSMAISFKANFFSNFLSDRLSSSNGLN